MAFGLRYYNEFTSLHYKRLVRVEILERDYTGDSEQISMGASLHLSDSGDGREVPVKKLTASLRLNSTRNFQFEHLFTADDRKYQVKIIRNGSTVFIGFLESDSYSEPYYSWKDYTVNLTARDNLGRLEDIPYGRYSSVLFRADNVIGLALQKTGISMGIDDNIQIYSSDMNTNDLTLGQTWINERKYLNEDNESESSLFVIEDILKAFGAQIRQVNGFWVIEEQANFYNRPTVQGNSASFPSYLANKLNFPLVNKAFRWINRDAEMIIQPAYKEILINQDYKVPESIYNIPELSDSSFINEGDKFLFDTSESFTKTITGVTPRDDIYFHLPSDNKLYVTGAERVSSSGADYYGAGLLAGDRCIVLTNKQQVKADTRSYSIKLKKTIINKTYNSQYELIDVFAGSQSSSSVALVLESNTKLYAMTEDGWQEYASVEAIHDDLKTTTDIGVQSEIEYFFSGFPEDGELSILVGAPSIVLTFKPNFRYVYFATSLDESTLTRFEDNEAFVNNSDILISIDENNNLTDDESELQLGQVPTGSNSSLIYYGGLFDTNGNAQTDWKRIGDTTAENLLKKVAIGYDLMNRQPSRQVTGTVIWDYDIWTNIDDQNKRLMINAIDEWNMNTDEMTAEWIEVFEYNNEVGEFDDGYDSNFNNNDSADYKTNSIFTLTEKFE